jgi:hypothetical protein
LGNLTFLKKGQVKGREEEGQEIDRKEEEALTSPVIYKNLSGEDLK